MACHLANICFEAMFLTSFCKISFADLQSTLNKNFLFSRSLSNFCLHNTIARTSFFNNQNKKPYYPRPTPVDLLIEEQEHYLNRATFDGTTIDEWNIDGHSEYQIQIKLHYMTMYATASEVKGNSDANIARAIVQGFTGQLKGWWDFHLSEHFAMKTGKRNTVGLSSLKALIFPWCQTGSLFGFQTGDYIP